MEENFEANLFLNFFFLPYFMDPSLKHYHQCIMDLVVWKYGFLCVLQVDFYLTQISIPVCLLEYIFKFWGNRRYFYEKAIKSAKAHTTERALSRPSIKN